MPQNELDAYLKTITSDTVVFMCPLDKYGLTRFCTTFAEVKEVTPTQIITNVGNFDVLTGRRSDKF